MVPYLVLCTVSWSWACPIAVCPWSTWSSSSSVCINFISLILLLRIRLTRRCGVCWSAPRGVPRPAYNDGGCASLSQRASQDWHTTMESMLDEGNAPEGVNLGPKETNSARGVEIRPGLGESRPGPAGIGVTRPGNGGPKEVIPARPDPPDPAQPSAAQETARQGAGGRGPAGEGERRPGRRTWRPSRDEETPAQPGWRTSRPSRGEDQPAQPGRRRPAQPG
jgi:hypothetical protein